MLVAAADLFRVGRKVFLVTAVDGAMMDTVIEAIGSTEDAECNGDMEPSIDNPDDLEFDGLDDTIEGRGEGMLGWPDTMDQSTLVGAVDDSEPELGWANTGPQRPPGAVHDYVWDEGDGDPDREDADPDIGIEDLPHDETWALL
jgi:hypothetical protein